MSKSEIELGNKVRDRVTGFEGIATAKILFLNGCVQFCVKPSLSKAQINKGEYTEGQYVDVGQLVFVSKGLVELSGEKDDGGMMSDMPGDTYRG